MIYKKQDIDRAFTKTITEFLAQGFQISTWTRCDPLDRTYSGVIACIDLCKGDDLLRVQIKSQVQRIYHERREFYSLLVGQRILLCTDEPAETQMETKTVDTRTFKIIRETGFYPVDKHSVYGARVFGDKATAKTAQEKREKRQQMRQISRRHELPACSKISVLRWLRTQPRMKTCRVGEIESVSRLNKVTRSTPATELECYEIKARGRSFKLYPPKKD